jgi:MYXO-CTERM domain-containing protein
MDTRAVLGWVWSLLCVLWFAAALPGAARAADPQRALAVARLVESPVPNPRDAAEAVRSLRRAGVGARPAVGDFAPVDVRHQAWRLTLAPDAVAAAVLFASAGDDGGFGAGPGHAAAALDTAEALLAAADSPDAPALGVARALNALLRLQRPDGGFAANGVDADLPTTGLALRAMAAFRALLPGDLPLNAAGAWLRRADTSARPALYEALRADALGAADLLGAEDVSRVRAAGDARGVWDDAQGTAAAVRVLLAAAPDLVFADARLSSSDVSAGTRVEATWQVRNDGLEPAGATTLAVRVGDEPARRLDVPALAPGETTPLSLDVDTTDHTGGLSIAATLDAEPDARVDESDEGNNAVRLRLHVRAPQPADLEVRPDLVALSPMQPAVGEAFEVAVVVRNRGDAAAGATTMHLYRGAPEAGGARLAQVAVPGIEAHADTTVRVPLAGLPAQATRLVVLVDPDARIAEAHRGNNRAVRALRIAGGADLAVLPGAVVIEPGSVVGLGTPVRLRVRVQNHGTSAAPGSLLTAEEAGGATLGEAVVPALGVGEVVEVALSFAPDRVGAWPLLISADADDVLVEADEVDNLTALVVDVTDAQLSVPPGDPGGRAGTLLATGRLDLGIFASNHAPLAVAPVRTALRVGSPDGPAQAWGDCGPFAAAPRGGTTTATCQIQVWAEGLPVGRQSLYFCVDATNLLAERDETDNCQVFPVDVQARRDVGVSLTFDPPEPEPGEWVEVTWRTSAAAESGLTQVRIRADAEPLMARSVPLNASGVLRWRAPDVRTDVRFEAMADAGLSVAEVNPADNVFAATVHVGGPPGVVEVRALAADRLDPAVAGRAGWLSVGVDAPTEVTFGALHAAATPEAPAVFPYTPDTAGEAVVHVATRERPAGLDWPVEIRAPGAPEALAAAFAPEGVQLTWQARAAATGYVLLRSGLPVGTPDQVLAPSLPLPPVLERGESYPIDLPTHTFIGAVGLDLSQAHSSVIAHWRLEALTERGRWTPLHEEGGGGGVATPLREITPVRARHLRLHVLSTSSSSFPARLALRGYAGAVDPAWLDDRIGAEAGAWRVAAQLGPVLTEAGPSVAFDRGLEAPAVSVTVDGAVIRLQVEPLPGRRVAGFLVEVDGADLPAAGILPTAVYPQALTTAALPLVFRQVLLDGQAVRRAAVAEFAAPRRVTALPSVEADPRWRVTDASNAPFAPGPHRRLTFQRPAADDDADLVFTPTFLGPPMLPGDGGALTVTLPAGLRSVAIHPMDAEGRLGVPAMLPVAVGGPRGLSNVTARAEGGEVRLSWTAPQELTEVVVSAPWGQTLRAPAAPGTLRFAPTFAGGALRGHLTFRLSPIDTAGNPAPVTDIGLDLLLDLPQPEALSADVVGYDLTARWTMPRPGDTALYALAVDGAAFGHALDTPARLRYLAAGHHTLAVSAMSGAGFTGPPAFVGFDVADDGPPGPIRFEPTAEWTSNTAGYLVSWLRPIEADAVAVEFAVNGEAPLRQARFPGTYQITWRPGVTPHRVRGRVVDGSGHASPWTEVDYTPPASFSAAGFSAGPLRADGAVPFTAPGAAENGYFVYRDGERLCDWSSTGLVPSRLSSGQWVSFHSPFGTRGDPGIVPWVAAAEDPHPTVTLDHGFAAVGTPVDRLRVAFATDAGIPDAFHFDARPLGLDWVEIARVAGNDAPVVVLELPDTPRRGAVELRFVVDHHAPGAAVQVASMQAFTCRAPAFDRPAHGGRTTYTARTWGPNFDPGPASPGQSVDVPLTDLALAAGSLRLSDDEFLPGDTVALVAPVENLGSNDAPNVDVVLRVAPIDCGVGAVEVARATVSVRAGQTAAAILPWAVGNDTGVLCAAVDPEGRIPEQREDNNTTQRSVVADQAFRTEVWANGEVTLLSCADEVRWAMRPAVGAPLFGTLAPGAATTASLTGAVAVSADAPFALHVGALRHATATLLRDCAGEVRTLDVTGDVPQNRPVDMRMAARSPGTVVFAPDRDLRVVGSEPFRWQGSSSVPSGLQLFEGDVPEGALRFFNPHQRADGRSTDSLRLTSDAPMIAWSYADLGFPFVGADGRMTGTDLVGFVGRSSLQFQQSPLPGEEIVLVSYDPDNRVSIERMDTGQVVATHLLPANGVASQFFAAQAIDGFLPLRVRATGRVAALNMSLYGSPAYGYAHALFIPGESGRLFDRRFVVPLTRNGRGEDFAPVTALYDATTVRVTSPDTGEDVWRGTLSRGESVNLLSDATVVDDPARRRLVVESDRPVSVYAGTGLAGAEMAPVLFAPENRADLTIRGVATEPALPLPGDVLAVHGEVVNAGVARARRVEVRVYDGPPDEGRLVHQQSLPRLDAGQPVSLDFALGLGEGVRTLFWVVDPEDVVAESREDNNVTEFTLANPPDLVPDGVSGEPVAGLPGRLRVRLRNDGGQPVEGARARLWADEAPLGSVTLDVPGAGSATVEVPWVPDSLGPVVVRVVVEAPEGVLEARLDNNVSTTPLTVAAPERDLVGTWTFAPAAPGPCDDVELSVALGEPLVVGVEAFVGPERVAAGRTGPDGRGTLRWVGDKPVGVHAVRLVVDTADAVVESDEENNTTMLDVPVADYATALVVRGPAVPVEAGGAVELEVTPTRALPDGARLEAAGFADTSAAGDAPVSLSALAPEVAGPVFVRVKARGVDGAVLAVGQGRYDVAPPSVGLRLGVWPVLAGAGVPVTLEATVRGAGEVVFLVDDAEIARTRADAPRSIARALAPDDAAGVHRVRVELRDAGGEALGTADATYERAGLPPAARVQVELDPQTATVGASLTVPVRLRNPEPGVPVSLDDVVVAITDEPPRRMIREDRLGVAHVVGADGTTVMVEVGPLPWTAGTWRLVARGERGGAVLGVGSAPLLLLDSDATPPPDAAPPRPDAAAPPPPDQGGDPRTDLGAPPPLVADLGADPRADSTVSPPVSDLRVPVGDASRDASDGPSPTDAHPVVALDAASDAAAGPMDARSDARVADARPPLRDARQDQVGEAGAPPEGPADPDVGGGGGTHAGGCDCRSTRGSAASGALWALALIGAFRRRRRRSR